MRFKGRALFVPATVFVLFVTCMGALSARSDRTSRDTQRLGLQLSQHVAFGAQTQPAQAGPAVTFPQGVASGDVTPFGAVLWTRVQPDGALNSPRQESLTVEVALNPDFRRPHFRTLKDDHGQTIHDQIDTTIPCARQIAP
jgi:hypothetical protein